MHLARGGVTVGCSAWEAKSTAISSLRQPVTFCYPTGGWNGKALPLATASFSHSELRDTPAPHSAIWFRQPQGPPQDG